TGRRRPNAPFIEHPSVNTGADACLQRSAVPRGDRLLQGCAKGRMLAAPSLPPRAAYRRVIPMQTPDLLRTTVSELAADLRAGRITAASVAEAANERHERLDPKLRAYKVWDSERARREAALADTALASGYDFGPFQGLPVSVKDLFGLRGFPTFAGSPKQLPESWEAEGPVIAALRAGMATMPGKTHTVEFAFGGLGTNPHWGAPHNPWDAERHRVPGGSSAGAGVSLWEGSCMLALGTDTAGSVRIPASMTG